MKLCERMDRCVKRATVVDFGLLKACLCAFGVMVGILVPKKDKKSALSCAAIVFSAAFVPLVVRSLQKTHSDEMY